MSGRIYFEPGKNPPFPGYEAWLEEVKRAPIWQAKAPRQYVPDMRDGLGKELFPPPPPRSNLEPEDGGVLYDAKTAFTVVENVWMTRHDLIWEMLWFDQFSRDEPDAKYNDPDAFENMFLFALRYHIKTKYPDIPSGGSSSLTIGIRGLLREIIEYLPLEIRRAPWLRKKYKS
jgi:hypothetical protein